MKRIKKVAIFIVIVSLVTNQLSFCMMCKYKKNIITQKKEKKDIVINIQELAQKTKNITNLSMDSALHIFEFLKFKPDLENISRVNKMFNRAFKFYRKNSREDSNRSVYLPKFKNLKKMHTILKKDIKPFVHKSNRKVHFYADDVKDFSTEGFKFKFIEKDNQVVANSDDVDKIIGVLKNKFKKLKQEDADAIKGCVCATGSIISIILFGGLGLIGIAVSGTVLYVRLRLICENSSEPSQDHYEYCKNLCKQMLYSFCGLYNTTTNSTNQ